MLRLALSKRPDIDGTFLAVPEGEIIGFGTIAFEHNISPDAAPRRRSATSSSADPAVSSTTKHTEGA